MPSPSSLALLRQQLAERFPDAIRRDRSRTAGPVGTGIAALDAVFPDGGLPRGQLTAWAPGGGAGAILRSVCRHVLARGERVVWIDGVGAVSCAWQPDAEPTPVFLRPTGRLGALRAAALLLRCGGFALVVLDPAEGEAPMGTETVRLDRAAREGGAAGVVLTERTSATALRISSRLDPRGVHWTPNAFDGPAEYVSARVDLRARASGWNAHVSVRLPIVPYDLRTTVGPVRDRRGAPRGGRAPR